MILYFAIGRQPPGPAVSALLPPAFPPQNAAGVPIKPNPNFDFSAMHDERKRADAITEALRAESQRNRRRPS
jgi:hypothetical protein